MTRVKVKMLKTAAGPEGTFAAVTVVELEEAEAALLIEAGAAERVVAAPAGEPPARLGEMTAIEAPERAVAPRPRPRKGGG